MRHGGVYCSVSRRKSIGVRQRWSCGVGLAKWPNWAPSAFHSFSLNLTRILSFSLLSLSFILSHSSLLIQILSRYFSNLHLKQIVTQTFNRRPPYTNPNAVSVADRRSSGFLLRHFAVGIKPSHVAPIAAGTSRQSNDRWHVRQTAPPYALKTRNKTSHSPVPLISPDRQISRELPL